MYDAPNWFTEMMNLPEDSKRSLLAYACGYNPEAMRLTFESWKATFSV